MSIVSKIFLFFVSFMLCVHMQYILICFSLNQSQKKSYLFASYFKLLKLIPESWFHGVKCSFWCLFLHMPWNILGSTTSDVFVLGNLARQNVFNDKKCTFIELFCFLNAFFAPLQKSSKTGNLDCENTAGSTRKNKFSFFNSALTLKYEILNSVWSKEPTEQTN